MKKFFFKKRDRRRFQRQREELHREPAPEPCEIKRTHRFITRDGHVNIKRLGLSKRQPTDWFHILLNMSVLNLLLCAGIYYFAINALFGILYLLDSKGIPGLRPYDFFDHFFFSVHVFATLGVDHLTPQSFFANVLVTVESLVGWCSFGLITGLLFSRFSRPSARVMFTHYAVIASYEGQPCLMFRAANRRGNQILQAQISVTLARNEETREGERVRAIYDLKLLRSTSSFFNLTWTIRHLIDETSPLYQQTPEDLKESETEIVVLLSGIDETFGQTVHGRFAYNFEEIVHGYRFQSMFGRDEHFHPVVDFSKFDEIEKTDEPQQESS